MLDGECQAIRLLWSLRCGPVARSDTCICALAIAGSDDSHKPLHHASMPSCDRAAIRCCQHRRGPHNFFEVQIEPDRQYNLFTVTSRAASPLSSCCGQRFAKKCRLSTTIPYFECASPRSIASRRLSPTSNSCSSYQIRMPKLLKRFARGLTNSSLFSLACEINASNSASPGPLLSRLQPSRDCFIAPH